MIQHFFIRYDKSSISANDKKLDHGSTWIMDQHSRINMDHGSWINIHGST
ncbi:hypothetical protein Lalb_Chr06g0165381 [Lupinus albus]|uniref:Uncharacterized protein n=1 Tax=Lupinus albus TaxID=3870 RepID=A0A6A4QDM6_LUPAL|nr:hypothetical protein Lalb_Chr06g0165381 [Lupinus albus]